MGGKFPIKLIINAYIHSFYALLAAGAWRSFLKAVAFFICPMLMSSIEETLNWTTLLL